MYLFNYPIIDAHIVASQHDTFQFFSSYGYSQKSHIQFLSTFLSPEQIPTLFSASPHYLEELKAELYLYVSEVCSHQRSNWEQRWDGVIEDAKQITLTAALRAGFVAYLDNRNDLCIEGAEFFLFSRKSPSIKEPRMNVINITVKPPWIAGLGASEFYHLESQQDFEGLILKKEQIYLEAMQRYADEKIRVFSFLREAEELIALELEKRNLIWPV